MTDYSSNSTTDGIRRADCTYPQSLHCGEISVRGTGCNFVGSNHALKSREKQPQSTVSPLTGIYVPQQLKLEFQV